MESKLRSQENRLDDAIVMHVKDHWSRAGKNLNDVKVGRVKTNRIASDGNLINPAQKLTVAYRSRGINSAFHHEYSWRGRLLLENLNVIEIQKSEYSKNCALQPGYCALELEQEFTEQCLNTPDYVQPQNGVMVVHSFEHSISVICL